MPLFFFFFLAKQVTEIPTGNSRPALLDSDENLAKKASNVTYLKLEIGVLIALMMPGNERNLNK